MKPEERLFELLGRLPDEMLEQDAKKRRTWIPAAAAACLLLAVGAGLWGLGRLNHTPDVAGHEDVTPAPSSTPFNWDEVDWTPSTINGELNQNRELNWPVPDENSIITLELSYSMLPVGERIAEYHKVAIPGWIPEAQRPRSVGEPHQELAGWYLPGDNRGLQYLLHEEEDGSWTLWEFAGFVVYDQGELEEIARSLENGENAGWISEPWFSLELDFSPYPYSQVLETVYGVASADDLAQVTVSAPNMDNTDAGQALQAEIGTHTVTDRAGLDAFYAALSSMTCYGSDHWDLIDRGDRDDPTGGLLNAVRVGRYLTVETAAGAVFDTLKYSAAGGQFYEYGGIAYTPLDGDLAEQMNRLFGIEIP